MLEEIVGERERTYETGSNIALEHLISLRLFEA